MADQQTNKHKQTQDMATNTGNTHRGRYLALSFLVAGGVALLIFSAPVAAQGPTVTPFPGPAMTATAAAQNMAQAEQQKRQGEQMKATAAAQRALATQLETAGNDAIDQGVASYQSASQDAASAAAAIQAQQIGIANEFLARSQANIETGRGQIGTARETITQLSALVDAQASTIISLTNRLQQAETDARMVRNAYIALTQERETNQRQDMIGYIFSGLLFVAVAVMLIALIWRVIRNRRDPPDDPPDDPPADVIDGGYTVSDQDERE